MRQNEIATARARGLRQSQTPAERRLWQLLRDRRLGGLKFRRQVPLGPYIADFCCPEVRLVVEADGAGHADARRDLARDLWIEARGFRILRLWNSEILGNPAGCAEAILAAAGEPR